MKKRLSRCLSVFLACWLTLSISSCGIIEWNMGDTADTGTEPADTQMTESETSADTDVIITSPEPTDSEKARARLIELRDSDLSASSVIIATIDNETVCPVNSDGDPVLASRADCRRAVEEKYNTHIISKSYTSKELFEAAKVAYNSDMYLADLMAIELSDVGAYHAEGLLANLYSLPHSDFTEEYFNASSVEASTFKNGLYAVAGAACLNPDYLECVYFNKDIATAIGADSLYDAVSDGSWTWDKFGELANLAASTGVLGHGAFADNNIFIPHAALSMGISYVSNEPGSVPKVNYLDGELYDRAKGIVNKLMKLIYKDNSFSGKRGNVIREEFSTGNLMFLVDSLCLTSLISDSTDNWGILPMPKYDEADEGYITPMTDNSPVFCALVNTPGYETSGLILRAINAAAYEYTLNAYKNYSLNYILRDSQSAQMLDIICESPHVDFAHVYASGFSYLDDASYGAVKKAVTTKTTLDTAYRQYKNAANRQLSASN